MRLFRVEHLKFNRVYIFIDCMLATKEEQSPITQNQRGNGPFSSENKTAHIMTNRFQK